MVHGIFYADDGMIVSRYPGWLQGAIKFLIGIFRRVEIMANVEKSKTMTCHPGDIFAGMPEEAFSWRSKGDGDTYRDSLRRCIPSPECGVGLTSGSMTAHRRLLHGTEPAIDWY